MSELVLRAAWRKGDPAIERDAQLFWRANDAMQEDADIEMRLAGLCAGAYQDERLVGIATAAVRTIASLRCKLAMYRTFVERGLRNRQIASKLGVFSRDLLEAWARDHPEEQVVGMGAVIQSRVLVEKVPFAVYPETKLAFIGYTQEGYQMRVYWFAHARISTYWPGDSFSSDGGPQ